MAIDSRNLPPHLAAALAEQADEAARRRARLMAFFNQQGLLQEQHARERAAGHSGSAVMLALVMADPARLRAFSSRLDDLDRASLHAMIEAEKRAEQERLQLEQLRAAASRDEQGRRVYRTADGARAYREDGTALTDDERAGVAWKNGAPTWEDYQQRNKAHDDAVAARDAIGAYRNRLDEARDRLKDGADLSADELDDLERGLDDMPPAVRDAMATAQAPQDELTSAPARDSSRGAFDRARLGDDNAVAETIVRSVRPTETYQP